MRRFEKKHASHRLSLVRLRRYGIRGEGWKLALEASIGTSEARLVSLRIERFLELPYHPGTVLLRFAWDGPHEGTGADLRRLF